LLVLQWSQFVVRLTPKVPQPENSQQEFSYATKQWPEIGGIRFQAIVLCWPVGALESDSSLKLSFIFDAVSHKVSHKLSHFGIFFYPEWPKCAVKYGDITTARPSE
jgi:hypothetical protein